MTTTATSAPVQRVATEMTRQIRALHALKAVLARGESDAERAMHTVLLVLDDTGPQRVSSLAERLSTDPSTTSRQTAELVKRGLLERLPDPDDRRAGLLAVTDAGRDVVQTMRERRHELLGQVLQDWSTVELGALGDLLARFADDLERTRDEMTTGPRPTSTRTTPTRLTTCSDEQEKA